MSNFLKDVISPYGRYQEPLIEIDSIINAMAPQGPGMPNVPSLDQLRRTYLFRKLFKDDYKKLINSEQEDGIYSPYASQVEPSFDSRYNSLANALKGIY